MRLSYQNVLLALLPLTVMAWTIWDVATHEFNRWTMLRTVGLVAVSVPAFIGALFGGPLGLRVGSLIGLVLGIVSMMIGVVVMKLVLG